MSLNKEIFDGFYYENILDVAGLFSNKRRTRTVLLFVLEEIKKYAELFEKGEVDILPIVYHKTVSKTGAGYEYFTTDYNFLVQCLARFIFQNDLGNPNDFISDFRVKHGEKENTIANIFLSHSVLERVVNIVYINTLNNSRLTVKNLKYKVPTVYQNDKISVEFASLFLVKKKLLELFEEDKNVVQMFEFFSKMSGAEQVAFNGENCSEFWKKNKKLKTVYMASNLIDHKG